MLRQIERIKYQGKYGWVICFACAMLLFCTGGLVSTGFSAYQPYLIQLGGLTNTQASLLLTVRTLFIVAGMLSARFLIVHLEVRRVAAGACLICAAAFLLYAFAKSPLVYMAGAVLAGLSLGCGGMITVSILISRWFLEHRGLALGICMAATGLSAIIASPFITFIVTRYSMRTSFLAEALYIFVTAVIVYCLLRNRPSSIQTSPIGKFVKDTDTVFARHNSPRHLFCVMLLGIIMIGITANTTVAQVAVLYRTEGFSAGGAATLVSLLGGALLLGKCLYGQIADRIGMLKASSIFYGLMIAGIGMCCLAGNGSMGIATAAALLTGLGLAVHSVSISIYASRVSTEADYARTLTIFQIGSTMGALVFSPIPGILADLTGSYVPAFEILFMISLAGSIILTLTYPRIRRLDRLQTVKQ